MKVKLFTHIDLDGIGCYILAIYAFGISNVDVVYCKNPQETSDKVKEFILNGYYSEYDCVFITDISINEEVAILINSMDIKNIIKLLDHHKTAEFLNVYSWATVEEYISNDKHNCGTFALYHYLQIYEHSIGVVDRFVETVRQYDTWEFKTKYFTEIPKQYNDLLSIMGREDFINMILQKLTNNSLEFTEVEKKLLMYEQKKIDGYIKMRKQRVIKKQVCGYSAGIVFAERNSSELGSDLCETMPELDFVMIINPSYNISYRTNKDIDVSKIAQQIGGKGAGGHPKAAGSTIDKKVTEGIVDWLLSEMYYEN